MSNSRGMGSVWSREFAVALLGFITPTAIAAALVYRRLLKSKLYRRHVEQRVTEACAQYVAEAEPRVARAPVHAAPLTAQSIRLPLENLRQRLVEFRGSIQQSASALGQLQECDCRFSMDLERASQVMHEAFLK